MCCNKHYTESVADVGLRPGKIKHNSSFYTVTWKIQRFTHMSWDWGRCLITRPHSSCSVILILCYCCIIRLFIWWAVNYSGHLPSSQRLVFPLFLCINLINTKSSILIWHLWNWKPKRNLMIFCSILGILMIPVIWLLKNSTRILWPVNVVLVHF